MDLLTFRADIGSFTSDFCVDRTRELAPSSTFVYGGTPQRAKIIDGAERRSVFADGGDGGSGGVLC